MLQQLKMFHSLRCHKVSRLINVRSPYIIDYATSCKPKSEMSCQEIEQNRQDQEFSAAFEFYNQASLAYIGN